MPEGYGVKLRLNGKYHMGIGTATYEKDGRAASSGTYNCNGVIIHELGEYPAACYPSQQHADKHSTQVCEWLIHYNMRDLFTLRDQGRQDGLEVWAVLIRWYWRKG